MLRRLKDVMQRVAQFFKKKVFVDEPAFLPTTGHHLIVHIVVKSTLSNYDVIILLRCSAFTFICIVSHLGIDRI